MFLLMMWRTHSRRDFLDASYSVHAAHVSTRVLTRNAGAVLAFLLSGPLLQAHEIGTTRVAVQFRQDQTFNIEVATDAQALLEKLNVTSGLPPAPETNVIKLQSTLQAFDQPFHRRVKIAFDGVEVPALATYSITPGDGTVNSVPGANISLQGKIPTGARQFTWTFGWTFATYGLTIRNASSANVATQWLEGTDSSAPFPLAAPIGPTTRLRTALRYLKLGFTHIMPNGLDHMLFVLGIYLLSSRGRSILMQVSAFTVAHSITLALSLYGIVSVSPRVVEPMIALSIAYVAVENVFLSELKSWRIVLVFAFGLLHGMGFAGALHELRIPRSEFVTALVTFNVGVEAGQLAVISLAFLLVGWHCSSQTWYRARIVIPASMAIACTAIYWTVNRLI
jgi:hydrogenase/urease accessory protein HupE